MEISLKKKKKAQTIRSRKGRALLPAGHRQNPQGALPASQR